MNNKYRRASGRKGSQSMKVSVIMLTYNREKLVDRAISSILKQTLQDFELIIIDNGSKDTSGQIADSYADIDSRIHVWHIPKNSIGYGRNFGLEQAKGEYITFIDDDDYAYPDMLEFLYQMAIEQKADIAVCGSEKEIDGKVMSNCCFEEKFVWSPEKAVIELLKRRKMNAAMPTKLISRELTQRIRFEENGNYDDISVTYKYFANAKKVVACGLPKYCFYRHSGNNSSFTTNDLLLTPEQLEEYFKAFRERTEYLSFVLPEVADYAQYSEWSYLISMCNKISKNNLMHCKKQLEFIKQELTAHYDEFYDSPYIEEFEKEFMRKYITKNKKSLVGLKRRKQVCCMKPLEKQGF